MKKIFATFLFVSVVSVGVTQAQVRKQETKKEPNVATQRGPVSDKDTDSKDTKKPIPAEGQKPVPDSDSKPIPTEGKKPVPEKTPKSGDKSGKMPAPETEKSPEVGSKPLPERDKYPVPVKTKPRTEPTRTPPTTGPGTTKRGPETEESTGGYGNHAKVPPGHYPPPGSCRIWYPNTPPGHQPPPQACSELANVPLTNGAFIVHNHDGSLSKGQGKSNGKGKGKGNGKDKDRDYEPRQEGNQPKNKGKGKK